VRSPLPTLSPPRVLKQARSRCPICHAPSDGAVIESDGKVYLKRTCPTHGERTVCIASDVRFYNVSCGSGCCAEAQPFDVLSTCVALIEIVSSCNIACPTCFSDSPRSSGVDFVPFDEIKARVDGVVARKGKIDILQLSGGEPTLHPDLFEILEWAQSHTGIGYVLVNTNGLRLAAEVDFARALERSWRPGKLQLYLQFDGPRAEGQRELRGADLRAARERAVTAAGAFREGGLPITLAMTVTPENLSQAWETIELGLRFPNVRGVSFQPMFFSGRLPEAFGDLCALPRRLNTADVILAAIEQSRGRLRVEDFTPLPCGDPNCAWIGYLLRSDEGVRSISELVDLRSLQGFLRDRVNYNLADLDRCGCESEPLGKLLRSLEIDASHTFRLFVKPFMDALTWDEDRIDRCCTHVIRPDGKLDSFCRYYSGFPGTWNAPH